MPVRGHIMQVEDNAERVGILWRSQGEIFLAEQAAELAADVERLRAIYTKRVEKDVATATQPRAKARKQRTAAAKTIDLRDDTVEGMVCSRHGNHDAAARCSRCREPFCWACILRPEATQGEPLCTGCALLMGGIRHRRQRPLVAPGREPG